MFALLIVILIIAILLEYDGAVVIGNDALAAGEHDFRISR